MHTCPYETRILVQCLSHFLQKFFRERSLGHNSPERSLGHFKLTLQHRRSFPGGTSDLVTVDPSTTHETRHVIDAGEHPSMGSAKAEFNDAQYVKDLRGAFSSVPRPKARWQDRYMKLMIVGETGQGDLRPTHAPTHTPLEL
jgi:hypothetical protein